MGSGLEVVKVVGEGHSWNQTLGRGQVVRGAEGS